MDGDRGLTVLAEPDQWARCAHVGTALLAGGGVELTWSDDAAECGPRTWAPAGLAFDRWCRWYRSWPAEGRVEVGRDGGGAVPGSGSDPHGEPCPGLLRHPVGLAVDRRQRLYVAEVGTGAVHVVDLTASRLLRKIRLPGRHPIDVTADCGRALVLVDRPFGLLVLDGRRGPRRGPTLVPPRCRGELTPCRVASGPIVLWIGADTTRGLVATADGTVLVEIENATDLDLGPDGLLVVARAPGQSLRRFRRDAGSWVELEPVGAPGYDGGAVAIGPDGRIAFTTATGVGTTSGSMARHATDGTVTTYRLDSGAYRTRWGRLFLDACLPPGTSVGVRCLTSDEDDVGDPLPASPPEGGARPVRHADRTPPLPSQTLLATVDDATVPFRRPTGPEQVWAPPPADTQTAPTLRTYEAPVAAPPGRYLWVQLVLGGTVRVSPRVRAIRVERPGHPQLRALPRSWSRAEADAEFLHRYLSPPDGLLHELDRRAAARDLLVDPAVTPADLLAWLAGFAGLVLDQRWPQPARRALVAQAYELFRRRGTKEALVRTLALYLGFRPAIVEQWQLRGLGGAVLGPAPEGPLPPAVQEAGGSTGTLGRFAIGGVAPGQDSYSTSAHRFAVLVPGRLTDTQRAVVRTVLDDHRPAHTCYELCELGPGMRVGRHLRLALTSYVGPGTATIPAVVGQASVGRDGVVGQPVVGARLGRTSIAQGVRVG